MVEDVVCDYQRDLPTGRHDLSITSEACYHISRRYAILQLNLLLPPPRCLTNRVPTPHNIGRAGISTGWRLTDLRLVF
ncbi:hypothetical protein TNCV_3176031 [Trichonephila clavipes]|nr:hypothetical protein TNCV_3176031 [Trichonephila clavipes]